MEMKVQQYILPITENGIKINYMTDAPSQVISNSFRLSRNVNDFIEILNELNFKINKHAPSISLNFDEK
ncbi:hypothetical protein LD11_gp263 [Bacillus phage Riley]|uniref:Uncharacterized protein n=1 Tax=Bacillus phage Riley TaxID=1486662 RepID=A0A075M0I8_9CAUD|nr:hypothetical protein LD11_gp263 [Bacillus phage Riley]AIF72139.1 hypothetical protein [Bacillus phage Riley]ULF48889.1 hypothetical protein [Bacillus phage BillyBob]